MMQQLLSTNWLEYANHDFELYADSDGQSMQAQARLQWLLEWLKAKLRSLSLEPGGVALTNTGTAE
ncbi:MAG: hypothetical protein HC800_18365 [Phormidesmis sp. RL_2_1]|nr:hypothetical protein [Phormidesmis sp. RL_2_1]